MKVVEVLPAADAVSSDPSISYMMGVAAQSLGNKPSAITWLTKSAGLKPTADIYWRLGTMYYDLNNAGQMQAAWSRALALALDEEKATGKQPPWRNDVLYQYGDSLDEVGKCAVWQQFVDNKPPEGQHLSVARTYTITKCGR